MQACTIVTFRFGVGIDQNDKPIPLNDRIAALQSIRAILTQTYGGLTEIDTRGYWTNPSSVVVKEDAKQIECIIFEEDSSTLITTAKKTGEMIREALNQSEVLVTLRREEHLG